MRELPSVDRDLLVRRHVEEIPPRQLAAELGVSSEVVRQRLSRALDRLRTRLAATERGGSYWARAFVALAAPEPQRLTVPVAPKSSLTAKCGRRPFTTTPTIPVAVPLTMSIAKTCALGGALLLLGTALLLKSPSRPPAWVPTNTEPSAQEFGGQILSSPENRGHRQASRSMPVVHESQPAGGPSEVIAPSRLQIVDEGGAPVPGARGAWVTRDNHVIEFKADDSAMSDLPKEPCSIVIAAASGHGIGFSWLENTTEIETLALTSQSHYRARVTVDGAPPTEEVRLDLPGPSPAMTFLSSGGYFVRSIDGVQHDRRPIEFTLPSDGQVHALDLSDMPSLTGRMIWNDTSEPVAAAAVRYSRVNDRGYGIDGTTWTVTNTAGRFSIGLHGIRPEREDVERSDPSIEWWLGERAHTIRIASSHPEATSNLEFRFVVATGDSFPIDIGEVRIKRLATVELRVLGETGDGWKPLSAGVRSAMQVVSTNRDGFAEVRVWDEDHLDVLALGYEFTRTPIIAASAKGVLEIRLKRAPALVVQLPPSFAEATSELRPRIRLTFDKTPFGPWNLAAVAKDRQLEYRMRRRCAPASTG